jgi:mannose-6-phosphate isomerase-like protein (cupin superfamily)
MPGYTIKNLKEIEDAAAQHGIDGLESRFGRSHIDSEHLGVTYFRYTPGFRTPFGHKHREQEEAYVVVAGSGRMKLDENVVDISQWDVVRVAPQVVRSRRVPMDWS